MNETTLGELIRRGLKRADFPALDANGCSGNLTRQDLIDFANEALAEMHYHIFVESYEEYFRLKHEITVSADQEDYPLPNDFHKLRKAWYKSGQRRYRIERFTLDDLDGFTTNPITAGTVELWYVPEYKKLESENQIVSPAIPVMWDSLAVLGIALRALRTEESDTSELTQEWANKQQEMKLGAMERDIGEPNRVSDVTNRWGTQRDILVNEGRALRYRVMGREIQLFERVELRGVSA